MKRIFFIKLIPLWTLLLVFISCKKSNEPESPLIPFETGDSWAYLKYNSDMNGDTVVKQVGDYTDINGFKGYTLTYNNAPLHASLIIDNDNNGNYVLIGGYSDKDSLFTPSIQYKKDTHKGDTWNCEEVYVDDKGSFRTKLLEVACIQTDTLIATPKLAGICNVYRFIDKYDPSSVRYDYVALSIGLMKSEQYYNNIFVSGLTLINFKFKRILIRP